MASPLADMFTESERVVFAHIASACVTNVDIVLEGPGAMSRADPVPGVSLAE